ncbi:hypothetical protein D6827_02445 [Candidatus Parcubacteria bacterium]|nr:MAG: hypothetical protein D6827_02445 [Candidatus Parcubacteria bacterium]
MTGFGYDLATAADSLYNNLGIDCTGGDYTGSATNADNNGSSDATALGTTVFTNLTASSLFKNTTAGSEDIHLLDTATIKDAGASVPVSYDGEGTTRPQGSAIDIGADEVAVASAGGVKRYRKRITQ